MGSYLPLKLLIKSISKTTLVIPKTLYWRCEMQLYHKLTPYLKKHSIQASRLFKTSGKSFLLSLCERLFLLLSCFVTLLPAGSILTWYKTTITPNVLLKRSINNEVIMAKILCLQELIPFSPSISDLRGQRQEIISKEFLNNQPSRSPDLCNFVAL